MWPCCGCVRCHTFSSAPGLHATDQLRNQPPGACTLVNEAHHMASQAPCWRLPHADTPHGAPHGQPGPLPSAYPMQTHHMAHGGARPQHTVCQCLLPHMQTHTWHMARSTARKRPSCPKVGVSTPGTWQAIVAGLAMRAKRSASSSSPQGKCVCCAPRSDPIS